LSIYIYIYLSRNDKQRYSNGKYREDDEYYSSSSSSKRNLSSRSRSRSRSSSRLASDRGSQVSSQKIQKTSNNVLISVSLSLLIYK
jgi:hypothetical protein